jgi:hypothetical protein
VVELLDAGGRVSILIEYPPDRVTRQVPGIRERFGHGHDRALVPPDEPDGFFFQLDQMPFDPTPQTPVARDDRANRFRSLDTTSRHAPQWPECSRK